MKRSLMVEELKEFMNENLNDFFTLEEAEYVLLFLENKGMKPPGYVGDPECIGSFVENEWEPE
jgi:hypothetical protein